MPGFEIGGVDVAVEPDFSNFGRRTKERLREEEANLPNVKIQAEPDLSTGFKRELTRLVREASAGVTMPIEVSPNIPTGFKKDLTALVREASAGVSMQIEARPALAAGFRKDLTEMVRRSAAGISVAIEVHPTLATGFRRELREAVAAATAGEGVEVEVSAKLSEGFRRRLTEQLQRSTKGLSVKIEAKAGLEKGFRRNLDVLLKRGKATTFNVFATPRLDPKFRSKLLALTKSKATSFPVTVELVAEAPRNIRTKLLEAIKKATEVPPLVAKVKIVPDLTDLRAKVSTELKGISAESKLRPGVDTNTLRHRLISDVTQTMQAANRLAKLNVVATIRTIGAKGLSVVEGTMRRLKTVGRDLAIGLGVVAAAVGAVGVAGLKTAGDLEATQRTFQIQLQSVQKGTTLFGQLVDVAKESVFQVPDLSKVANQLIQVTRLSKSLKFSDISSTLLDITDLGAALNLTPAALERVALALTKIAGRGKLTGEELRSISKNAPALNVIGLIADHLGVSVPEAFDAIRAGAVSSNEAISVILKGIKDFPGAAGAGLKQVTQTFKGAMSNLPDILRLSFFQSFEKELPEITKIIAPDGPLIQAFNAAAPAFASAFTPLAQGLFSSLTDFAPALQSAATTTVPIFSQLTRASERLGLQTRRAFDAMGPGLKDLAETAATLLAALAPLLPLVGDFVSLVAGGLSRAIEGLISGGAIDTVLGFFTGLHDALADLIPILVQVAQEVGGALLKAFADIDLGQLGKSLGDIATAGGDLLVALAPLIPELVKVVAIFAEGLAPVIEDSIPLVQALITIITPLAEGLAHLGPSLIILLGIGKAALALGNGLATLVKFRAALENLRHTHVTIAGARGSGGRVIEFDGSQVIDGLKAITAAAAVTAAGMTAYFAAASDDITTQITSIAASVGSIAIAFAVDPIAGALAALGAGVGAVFGVLARKANEARKEAEATQRLADDIQQSFKVTGIDTVGKKVIGIVDAIAKQSEKATPGVHDFLSKFGVDLRHVAVLIATNHKAYDAYVRSLVDRKVQDIFEGNRKAISSFSDEVSKSADAITLTVQTQRDLKNESRLDYDAIKSLSGQFADGTITATELGHKLRALGVTGSEVGVVMRNLRDSITTAILKSQAAKFGLKLDDSVLKAIDQQQQLAQVQDLLKTDNDRLTDSFSGFQTAVSSATTAIQNFRNAQKGDAQSATDSILNTIGTAKQLIDLQKQQKDGSISAAEAELQRQKLISDGAEQNSNVIGRLIVKANGNYSTFQQATDKLRRDTIAQLEKALGLSAEQASDLADQMLDIPTKTEFEVASNLPETRDAAKELNHQLDLLNQRHLKDIELNIRANLTTTDKTGQHIGKVNLGFDPSQNALGKLVRKPELSWVGEDGPELILPLNDPARVAALLREAQTAGLLNTAALNLGGQAPAVLQQGVDPKAGQQFTKEAGAAINDLGAQLKTATDPGLEKWRGGIDDHLTHVVKRIGTFGGEAKASMQQAVNGLTATATAGSSSVVGALRSGLEVGTATVKTIVRSYSRQLAASLNPVLAAIGQPKIDVSQFRRGGVNDPRIVPDGSYNVHVFGERGTHGEAYIPFDPSLKSSSRSIAEETVRRLGGQTMWFRRGGVTGDTKGLNPEFMRRLERWSEKVGSVYNVDSGLRSLDEQRRLYQRYIAGVPGQAKAAVPGQSMHNFGLASDGNRWGSLRPGDMGLVFRVPGEPWHVEPLEARTWARQGAADAVMISPLAQPVSAGSHGSLSMVAKKTMDFGYQQALGWAARQIISSPGGNIAFSGGSANEAAAASAVRLAMKLTGVPDNWFGPLMTLIGRESGFDPLAMNLWDANARAGHPTKGLAQMRDDTFLAHALPGHTNIFAALDNIASAIRYILDRYGSIFSVQQADAGRPPRGYENGGMTFHDQVVRVSERNKPEVIIPLTRPARARELAHQSGLDRMLDGEGYHGPKTVIEHVSVEVKAPDAASPDAYAASMANRSIPAIASAVERALG